MLGRFLSGTGSYFNLIALNLFILIKTHSAEIMGFSMAAKILAGCLFAPYLGKLADKINRKLGMLLSDAILGITMLLLAICPDQYILITSFVVQICLGIFQNFFMINFQAAMPCLAPAENLRKANAWYQAINCSTIVIGALSATIFISLVGYRGAFIIDGISYFISFLIIMLLPLTTRETPSPTSDNLPLLNDSFTHSIKFLLQASPFIFIVFCIRLLDGLGSGSHNIALPVFSQLIDAAHPNKVFGYILAAWGIGNLGCAILHQLLKNTQQNYLNQFIYSTLIMSIFWILTFQKLPFGILITIACITGFFDASATINYSVILQQTKDAIRGRVMGMSTIVMTLGFGGGMLLSSIMIGMFTPSTLVTFWHGIPIVVITLFIMYYVIAKKKVIFQE